jgi:hypothetical protein
MYVLTPFSLDQKLYAFTFDATAHSSAASLLVNLERIADTPAVYDGVGITIVYRRQSSISCVMSLIDGVSTTAATTPAQQTTVKGLRPTMHNDVNSLIA